MGGRNGGDRDRNGGDRDRNEIEMVEIDMV